MEKKKKNLILSLVTGSIILGAVSLATGLGIGLSNKKNDFINDPIDQKNEFVKYQNISSFNTQKASITNKNISRKINVDVYETDLIKKYGDKFKYPSWNYNYESNQNRYQEINGETIDGMDLVFNERVDFENEKVYFSNPNFILSEIANGKLKKHPAADVWFENSIPNNIKAVSKSFSISSYVYGITSLGLYIPPGEIATLKFSEKTLEKMKNQNVNNFQVIINSSYWDNRAPGDTGQISNRYPFVKTVFNIQVEDLITNNGEFKFGSPFGGTISIKVNSRLNSSTYNTIYNSFENYEFDVVGAIEMLSYFHKITTKEEWDNQVKRVLNNEIVAPAMSIDFSFGSMNIALTSPQTFAYKHIEEIVYPYETIEKWTSFLFVSEYFASRDLNSNVTKLDFEFCDDIWGGNAAYGGGNALYSPLNWAKNSFLSGISNWTIANNWGTFHEINHNFEQNSAMFNKLSHGKTNQLTMVILSLLSDTGRWRNIYNPNSEFSDSGWTKLSNMYGTINFLNQNPNSDGEYELQNILLYALGTYNFMDYIRYDVKNNPSTGGFKEIVELSEYFQLNFWPALENFYPFWNDGWPSSYNNASAEEKEIIDRLNNDYKAFDFVGNIYATGHYLYNNETNKYDYTNDMQAPIDIPAGKSYVFDFEKGINSINKNFKWSTLKFDSKTKSGGILEYDKDNNKKLIYTPPKNSVGEIDEFNVSIVPSDFEGKSDNYVSEYIWKIKLRLVANLPVVSIYKEPESIYNSSNFYKDYEYLRNEDNVEFSTVIDPSQGFIINQNSKTKWNRGKLSFNFVAPEDGIYNFKIKADSWIFIVDDRTPDQIWWRGESVPVREWLDTGSLELKKGEIVPISIYFTHFIGKTKMEYIAYVNNKKINVFENSLVPWSDELASDPRIFLSNKYQYKSRTLIMNDFQTSLYGLNVSRDLNQISKKDDNGENNYTFISKQPNDPNIDKRLSEFDKNYFEHWGSLPFQASFDVEFKKNTKIGTIIFGHRTDNHWQARPTWVKIKNQNNEILYEGEYGIKYNDRSQKYSLLVLDQIYEVSKLSFEFKNTKKESIIFDSIHFSSTRKLEVNKIFSIQNENINFSSNWKLFYNDEKINISDVNNSSAYSRKQNDSIEFYLNASGFDIIGQKNINSSSFDLYINDKLIETVHTNNVERLDNQILYSYTTNTGKDQLMKIKIVNKENKLLFINYFQTYGEKVYIKNNDEF